MIEPYIDPVPCPECGEDAIPYEGDGAVECLSCGKVLEAEYL